MRRALTVRGGAVAALLTAILSVPVPAAADTLEMFIENQSAETLTYNSETNVESYPPTIAPSTTSDEIRADGANKGSVGVIGYKAGETCLVTLEFNWIFNPGSDRCDDKNFTIVNTGLCTLARAGDCYGSDDCKCNFTFNTGASN